MTINRLFLSFAAVLYELEHGRLSPSDLDRALFCCSEFEVQETDTNDFTMLGVVLTALTKARDEGRLILAEGGRTGNPITFGEINALLAQHGAAPLLMAGGEDDKELFKIPMYSSVPTCTDAAVQVLWAACPHGKDWRRSWGLAAARGEVESASPPVLKPTRLNRMAPNSVWRKALSLVGMAWIAENAGLSPQQLDVDRSGDAMQFLQLQPGEGINDAQTQLLLRITLAGHLALQAVTDLEKEPDAVLSGSIQSLARMLVRRRSHEPRDARAVTALIENVIAQAKADVLQALSPNTLRLVCLANALEEREQISNGTWKGLLSEPLPVVPTAETA